MARRALSMRSPRIETDECAPVRTGADIEIAAPVGDVALGTTDIDHLLLGAHGLEVCAPGEHVGLDVLDVVEAIGGRALEVLARAADHEADGGGAVGGEACDGFGERAEGVRGGEVSRPGREVGAWEGGGGEGGVPGCDGSSIGVFCAGEALLWDGEGAAHAYWCTA